MAGEQRDLLDVSSLGQRCEIANLHVVNHATAKCGHRQLLCEMVSATWRRHIVSRLSCQARVGSGQLLPTGHLILKKQGLNHRITAKRFSPMVKFRYFMLL